MFSASMADKCGTIWATSPTYKENRAYTVIAVYRSMLYLEFALEKSDNLKQEKSTTDTNY